MTEGVHRQLRGRRGFLLGALGVTGALVVGWGVLPPRSRIGDASVFPASNGEIALNGWIKVASDNTVVVAMPRVEMGQGIYTAFAMLVADELDVPLTSVRAQAVTSERIYGNVAGLADGLLPIHPDDQQKSWARAVHWMLSKTARELGLIVTGGSSSVADAWLPLREAAASARAVLVEAAARKWQVDAAHVSIHSGMVCGPKQQCMQIGAIAADAARIRPPSEVRLKPVSNRPLLGQETPRIDAHAKSDGSAIFAIDVRPEGICYAAVMLAPALGGKPGKLDDSMVRVMPGVIGVVLFDGAFGGNAGVAVVAEHYWQARQALEQLAPTWIEVPEAMLNSADIERTLSSALHGERSGFTYRNQGDGLDAIELPGTAKVIEAEYRVPYVAHAAMEPINCTAQVREGRVHLWAPTQTTTLARMAAARAAGVDGDRVDIDVPLLGGGFGRRLESDFVAQAVSIAMHTKGRPVQVIWSREQDIRHDFYRPQVIARLRARVTDGTIDALASRSAGQSILDQALTRITGFPGPGFDRCTCEGMFDMPYEIPHQHVAHVNVDLPVPVGYWRSVGHSYNAFFRECFIDEVAAVTGRDPIALRRSLLKEHPRELRVLDTAARAAGLIGPDWLPPADGQRAFGFALHSSFGSVAALLADVSLEQGRLKVHRMVCAVDCGFVINPQIVRQQVDSGIAFGLGAALYGKITFEQGRVMQSNFTDFPILSMAEMPRVETYIVESAESPTGIGEVAVPPVAPAVANALFRFSGKRCRSLPLQS